MTRPECWDEARDIGPEEHKRLMEAIAIITNRPITEQRVIAVTLTPEQSKRIRRWWREFVEQEESK